MLNNFIFAKKKSLFTSELAKGNILDEAIVFIEDTKEIWNHGTYFDCSSVDLSNYNTKEEIATELAKYITTSDLNNAMSGITGQINNLSSNLNDGLDTANQNAESARNLAQSVQDSLSSYATQTYVNTQISNLVDSAPETLNTLNELATAITEHKEVTDLLDSAISNKADKSEVEVDVEIEDGVYAITADGDLIDYNIADSSCTNVALIKGNHRYMIAKNNATNGSNSTLYWCRNLGNTDIPDIMTVDTVDGINSKGYLSNVSSPQLSTDYTTWTSGALSDFNGKSNTGALLNAIKTNEISLDSRDMCKVLESFNEGGYTDWYIPALGQLALLYLNMQEINTALQKIGGGVMASADFWSSTEKSSDFAWNVLFVNSQVSNASKGTVTKTVRFIRDLKITKSLKEKVQELESNKADRSELETKADKDSVYSIEEIDSMFALSKYEFVDLGLPSGLKWATCNIGANKPEESGLYFSWGETQGYKKEDIENYTKQFLWRSYKFASINTDREFGGNLTKYNLEDNLTTLEPSDDAAYVSDNAYCRTPTKAELEELIVNTVSTLETLNGVNGARFIGANGNSIFIPIAGIYDNDADEDIYNPIFSISSSSVDEEDTNNSYILFYDDYEENFITLSTKRYIGSSVRAVQESNANTKFDPSEVYNRLSDLEKAEIPTKTSQLVNDSNFVVDNSLVDYTTYANGVYAVAYNGELVAESDADSSCLGVALICDNQKIMIAKENATNDGSNYTLFYNYSGTISNLENYTTIDGSKTSGTIGTDFSIDYKTWNTGALSDFDGFNNTSIIAEYADNSMDMCTVLESFNSGTNPQSNLGYNDWYVPSLGQAALIYLYKTDIETILDKIGGVKFSSAFGAYWTSSKYNRYNAWYISFSSGSIGNGQENYTGNVRFIRNLTSSVKARISALESQLQSLTIEETDPIFSASPASRITDSDILTWSNKPEQTDVVDIVENLVSDKLDTTTAASTYATKTENNSKVTGDGVMTIKKVTELPSSPDPNTLYVITKTS